MRRFFDWFDDVCASIDRGVQVWERKAIPKLKAAQRRSGVVKVKAAKKIDAETSHIEWILFKKVWPWLLGFILAGLAYDHLIGAIIRNSRALWLTAAIVFPVFYLAAVTYYSVIKGADARQRKRLMDEEAERQTKHQAEIRLMRERQWRRQAWAAGKDAVAAAKLRYRAKTTNNQMWVWCCTSQWPSPLPAMTVYSLVMYSSRLYFSRRKVIRSEKGPMAELYQWDDITPTETPYTFEIGDLIDMVIPLEENSRSTSSITIRGEAVYTGCAPLAYDDEDDDEQLVLQPITLSQVTPADAGRHLLIDMDIVVRTSPTQFKAEIVDDEGLQYADPTAAGDLSKGGGPMRIYPLYQGVIPDKPIWPAQAWIRLGSLDISIAELYPAIDKQ